MHDVIIIGSGAGMDSEILSEAGWKYMDCRGIPPNKWDGVSQKVLDQYDLANPDKYISLYLKPEERRPQWDEEGKLVG